jgi:hypothetical protein
MTSRASGCAIAAGSVLRSRCGSRSGSSSERERFAAIGQDASQHDHVLDFLAAEQPLAGLRRHGDAAALQGFLMAPQLRTGRRQQGDVARLAGTLRAAATVNDGAAFDQPGAKLGDGIGFGVTLLFDAGVAVFVGHGDIKSHHACKYATTASRRRKSKPRPQLPRAMKERRKKHYRRRRRTSPPICSGTCAAALTSCLPAAA